MRLLRLWLAMTGCFVILLALISFTSTLFGQEFKRALPGRTFSFLKTISLTQNSKQNGGIIPAIFTVRRRNLLAISSPFLERV